MVITKRQEEVACLLAQGMSYKAVARELGLSPETVHTHAKIVFMKTGLKTKGELWKLFVSSEEIKSAQDLRSTEVYKKALDLVKVVDNTGLFPDKDKDMERLMQAMNGVRHAVSAANRNRRDA